MGNDIVSYRISIGHFYCKTDAFVMKKVKMNKNLHFLILILIIFIHVKILARKCFSLSYKLYHLEFLSKPISTFVILMLIILSNNVELNPGPNIADLSIFHLNIRSMRNKIDYIDSICHESDISCLTETHLDDRIINNDIV